jgi:hypothetical protein
VLISAGQGISAPSSPFPVRACVFLLAADLVWMAKYFKRRSASDAYQRYPTCFGGPHRKRGVR